MDSKKVFFVAQLKTVGLKVFHTYSVQWDMFVIWA